ncbi:MAG: GGDEF domain-containing protein [Gemmatimonadota bacterium]
MVKWYFERPSIPRTGAALSLIALAVPVLASTGLAEAALQYEALIWLCALIPAFLLAYYRGWRGVALGFAAAMLVMTVTQLLILTAGTRLPDWPLMLAITVVFTGISLVLGALVEQLHAAREKAEKLALFDPLTAVPNRRYLELLYAKAFAAAARGVPLVVVLFDVDQFKEFNDLHGHGAGDEVLRRFAHVLHRNTRDMNLSGRLGGDEFLAVLSAATVEGALVFVDRVRNAMVGEPITVSVGVAGYVPGMATTSELLAAADRALYLAKENGGNCVRVAAELPVAERTVVAGGDVAARFS